MQIVVLGMHRSGTSLTTRIINMMGAYFGPPGLALAASSDNPKGFWERRDVLDANRALLHHSRCNWFQVKNWNERLAVPEPIAHRIHLILNEMNPHRPWVMKDPRLCLTLPCWKPFLQTPLAVVSWRDPLEIARSLELRNSLPIEYGLALWEYHAVHLIRHATNLPKIFTRHDAMMASPLEATKALYEALVKAGVRGLHLPADADILDFVELMLHRARKQDVTHTLSPHQQKLSAMLRGESPFDANSQVSPEAIRIMESGKEIVLSSD